MGTERFYFEYTINVEKQRYVVLESWGCGDGVACPTWAEACFVRGVWSGLTTCVQGAFAGRGVACQAAE